MIKTTIDGVLRRSNGQKDLLNNGWWDGEHGVARAIVFVVPVMRLSSTLMAALFILHSQD